MAGYREALGERFEFVDRLGDGPLGEVWRVWDWDDSGFGAAHLVPLSLRSEPGAAERCRAACLAVSADPPAGILVRGAVTEGGEWALVVDWNEGDDAAATAAVGEALRQRLAVAQAPVVEPVAVAPEPGPEIVVPEPVAAEPVVPEAVVPAPVVPEVSVAAPVAPEPVAEPAPPEPVTEPAPVEPVAVDQPDVVAVTNGHEVAALVDGDQPLVWRGASADALMPPAPGKAGPAAVGPVAPDAARTTVAGGPVSPARQSPSSAAGQSPASPTGHLKEAALRAWPRSPETPAPAAAPLPLEDWAKPVIPKDLRPFAPPVTPDPLLRGGTGWLGGGVSRPTLSLPGPLYPPPTAYAYGAQPPAPAAPPWPADPAPRVRPAAPAPGYVPASPYQGPSASLVYPAAVAPSYPGPVPSSRTPAPAPAYPVGQTTLTTTLPGLSDTWFRPGSRPVLAGGASPESPLTRLEEAILLPAAEEKTVPLTRRRVAQAEVPAAAAAVSDTTASGRWRAPAADAGPAPAWALGPPVPTGPATGVAPAWLNGPGRPDHAAAPAPDSWDNLPGSRVIGPPSYALPVSPSSPPAAQADRPRRGGALKRVLAVLATLLAIAGVILTLLWLLGWFG
ncbi:MAG: hypothetical protein LBR33_05755 [Propionibacteriaceae bacterium]|nr:hypothetical protein [Propionibacteriaceae bacterium]